MEEHKTGRKIAETETSLEKRDDIFVVLDELHTRALDMLGKNDFTLQDIRLLAEYLASIRRYLRELGRIERSRGASRSALIAMAELQARYADLEGAVKEARNVLDRGSA